MAGDRFTESQGIELERRMDAVETTNSVLLERTSTMMRQLTRIEAKVNE
jgi:hypothetical protein